MLDQDGAAAFKVSKKKETFSCSLFGVFLNQFSRSRDWMLWKIAQVQFDYTEIIHGYIFSPLNFI